MPKQNYESFIFTHIPKCGGTSFRQYINEAALASGIKANKIYVPGFNGLSNDKNLPQLSESELDDIKGNKYKILANHSKYGEEISLGLTFDKPFYFTILRDPVKRFISHYHFFYYKLGYKGCKGITIDKLPEAKFEKLLADLSNIQVGYLSNIKFNKVVGLDNVLKISKYNLKYEFNAFGLVEDMETCLKDLEKKLPKWISFSGDFPVLNTSNSKKVDLPEEVIEKIKEANQYDIELYEFGKDLLKSKLKKKKRS